MNSIENFGFNLNNLKAEYESGTVVKFTEFENVSKSTCDNKMSVSFDIPFYHGELVLSELEENVFSLSAKLIPSCQVGDKVRKMTTFSLSLVNDDDIRMYINNVIGGRTAGMKKLSELRETNPCGSHFSFYNVNNPKNAFTVTGKLPAKFASVIEITKSDSDFCVDAYTVIPFTYEGEFVCQEWIICTNMSTDVALTKCADMCSNGREFINPIGWSTWDYYFTSATEDDVKSHVDFIANDEVLSKKVKYIALDDGWQQREGDWRSGCRFPGGLKSLVEYINSKGFEAGIWVAPTRLHFLCGTVMRRYDFLVRDEFGDPVKDEDMYILDPTHPDGEQFIRETFTYLAECGFTFYKLDFVSNMVTMSSRFYDKSAGHFDALNRLFTIVRETVPKGSHIMGCSLPYGADVNMSDSRRTGLDIHNVWGHLDICTSIFLPQFASNGKLYRNDLDYLVVRGKDTSDDTMTNVLLANRGRQKANPTDGFVWRGGDDFNYEEAKTWATILLAAGSSIFMGDCLPKLNEKGLEIIRKTVSEADFVPATPVFGDENNPSVWYKKELSKIYIINFTDEKRKFTVNLEDIGMKNGVYEDIFTGEKITANTEISLNLDAHASVAFKLI